MKATQADGARIVAAAALVLLELAGAAALLIFLGARAAPVFVVLQTFSGVLLLALMGSSESGAYRTAWMGCALVLGAGGVMLYLLFGRRHESRLARLPRENMLRAQQLLQEQVQTADIPSDKVMRALGARGFPAYPAQECTYFPSGEAFWVSLLADMSQAKESIELEFFICCPGKILEKWLEIAARAHERGVSIRLLVDDAGTLLHKDRRLREKMERAGVDVRIFNPIARGAPHLTLNFRDHRKIAVIDGRIAYTGGVNLADEYANLYPKHGHWKDTGVRLTGAAVYSFRMFFRALWAAAGGQRLGAPDMERPCACGGSGWVQPYQCAPAPGQRGQAGALYALLIHAAQRRVWITTPYLLLDDVLESALILAAQSGVDVRIIVPGVPDHPLVALAGEAHYSALMQGGVKLYRYMPGFMHAKMCLCDDELASIGTVNLDFRSLYLHFEDGVILRNVSALAHVRADMEAIAEACEQITPEAVLHAPALRRLMRMLLRAAAPML